MAKILIKLRQRIPCKKYLANVRTTLLGKFKADIRFNSNNDIELTISKNEFNKLLLVKESKEV